MPFDGSGNFSRANSVASGESTWQDTEGLGRDMESLLFDEHDQDIADGLTACLTKNGTSTPTANIPMGGFVLTGLGSATAITQSPSAAQIINTSLNYGGTSAGSSDAYTISLPVAPASYVTGMTVTFKADRNNTSTSPTINVNGLGAKNMRQKDGATTLLADDIIAGQIVFLQYNGTHFDYINPRYPNLTGAIINAVTASQYLKSGSSKGITSVSASTAFTEIVVGGKTAVDTWTPAVTANGAMTATADAVNTATYQQVGAYVFFQVSVSFTIGGTPDTILFISNPPVSGTSHPTAVPGFICYAIDGGGTTQVQAVWRYHASNGITVFRPGLVNWTAGASASITINGAYPVA